MKVELSRITILKTIIVTLPFGWIDLLPLPYTSLTFMLIYAYFAAAFLALPRSLSRNAVRNYGIFLFGMWLIMLLRTVFDGGATAFGSWSQLRQILFYSAFFVVAVPDVSRMVARGESVERYFLFAMLGMILMYFGGFVNVHEVTGRASLQGVNPNAVGLYAATAFVIFMDMFMRGSRSGFSGNWRLIMIPAMLLLLVILYRTGSRGGVLILAAAVTVYFLGWRGLTRKQLLLISLSVPVAFAAIWILVTTGPVAERLTSMDEDIRLQTLWPTAIEVVKQYPIFGAGFDRTAIIMRRAAGFDIAPHNELLKVATASGLAGISLFALFLHRLYKRATRFRQETGSALRLAILVIVVLQLGKGGGALQLPFIWIMFLLLSSHPLAMAKRKPVRIPASNIESEMIPASRIR